jgi:hypothetical protein
MPIINALPRLMSLVMNEEDLGMSSAGWTFLIEPFTADDSSDS